MKIWNRIARLVAGDAFDEDTLFAIAPNPMAFMAAPNEIQLKS